MAIRFCTGTHFRIRVFSRFMNGVRMSQMCVNVSRSTRKFSFQIASVHSGTIVSHQLPLLRFIQIVLCTFLLARLLAKTFRTSVAQLSAIVCFRSIDRCIKTMRRLTLLRCEMYCVKRIETSFRISSVRMMKKTCVVNAGSNNNN
jgi:hypothetical protein